MRKKTFGYLGIVIGIILIIGSGFPYTIRTTERLSPVFEIIYYVDTVCLVTDFPCYFFYTSIPLIVLGLIILILSLWYTLKKPKMRTKPN